MENAYAYDNLLVLKRVLNINMKNLKKDIQTPEDSVLGRSNRKKLRYLRWILDLIKSDGDFTYQELLDIIDLKTEAREKDLANALGKNQKEIIEDSIKSLAWLRNIIETTRGMGFNDIVFA
ncbi:MAG TPA: hypothetical protein VF220_04570 [Nitrososphaeraceae archaeon]